LQRYIHREECLITKVEILKNDIRKIKKGKELAKEVKKDQRVLSKAGVLTSNDAEIALKETDEKVKKKTTSQRRKTQPPAVPTTPIPTTSLNTLPTVPALARSTRVRFELPLRPNLSSSLPKTVVSQFLIMTGSLLTNQVMVKVD
jgi:hypothetical protein